MEAASDAYMSGHTMAGRGGQSMCIESSLDQTGDDSQSGTSFSLASRATSIRVTDAKHTQSAFTAIGLLKWTDDKTSEEAKRGC